MPHRFSFPRHLAFGLLSWSLLAGCGQIDQTAHESEPPDDVEPPGPTPAIDYGVTGVTVSPDPLQLEAGGTRSIEIVVSPPDDYPVQLSLVGGPEAVFLDKSVVTTNRRGEAEASLTVVSAGTQAFELKVTVGTFSTRVPVTISPQALATLVVVPSYAGERPIDEWKVTLGSHSSCLLEYDAYDQSDTLRFDGALEALQIGDVQARDPVTVLVSSKRYVFGCVQGNVLKPMSVNTITVPMSNRAVDTSMLDFAVRWGLDAEGEFWAPLNEYLAQLTARFRGDAPTDVEALLDEMEVLASSSTDFAAARAEYGWQALLEQQLTPDGARSGLTSRISRWLAGGSLQLARPDAFEGRLQATDTTGRGLFTLNSVAGLVPNSSGAPAQYQASVAADAQDILRVGFKIRFQPSVLFTALASQAATQSNSSTTVVADGGTAVHDAPSALARILDCPLVGQWLTRDRAAAFGSCDAACMGDLCEQALDARWQAIVTSDTTGAAFDVSAAGPAHLDERASAVGFAGTWVGETDLFADTQVSVQGTIESVAEADGNTLSDAGTP